MIEKVKKITGNDYKILVNDLQNNLKVISESLNKLQSSIHQSPVIKTLVIYIDAKFDSLQDELLELNITTKEEDLGFLPPLYSHYENDWTVANIITFPSFKSINELNESFFKNTFADVTEKTLLRVLKNKEYDYSKFNAIIFVSRSIVEKDK